MSNYLTSDEAARWVGQQANADMADLEDAVAAVSRAIDNHCQRQFGQVTSTARTMMVDPCSPWVIEFGPFGDLVTATTVKTDDGAGTFATTLSASDYVLEPVGAATVGVEAQPYTRIRRLGDQWPTASRPDERQDQVQITGTWGWPAVPDAVKQACRIQVARIFKRADSPLGVAGFGEFGVVRVSRLDPDVVDLLAPYRLVVGGVA